MAYCDPHDLGVLHSDIYGHCQFNYTPSQGRSTRSGCGAQLLCLTTKGLLPPPLQVVPNDISWSDLVVVYFSCVLELARVNF